MARVDLSDYGYVNARVRGMRSYLLSKDFFIRLVEADSFDAMYSMLEQTVYRRDLNEAVLTNPERPDYDQALSLNQIASFRKILDSTGGEAHMLCTVLMSRYDVQNIKTVLRGKKGNATPSEVLALMVPVGSVKMDILEQMAQAREIRDAINVLISAQIKYGKVLAAAYEDYQKKDMDLAVLELALDKFHYSDGLSILSGKDSNVEMVREILTAEIDMRNISTLVRIRGLKLDDEEVENLRIAGGTLSQDEFLGLHRLGDIVQIVSEYPDPRLRKLLEKALAEYQEIDVVAFDKELEREIIRRGVAMSNVDVLGIGVTIGYLFSKQNEIINLRIMLRGKMMDRPEADVKKDLFFVGPEEDKQ
ncbi:MAG: V-type ATPase subunit [Candidatus Geothermincolia bacterium]